MISRWIDFGNVRSRRVEGKMGAMDYLDVAGDGGMDLPSIELENFLRKGDEDHELIGVEVTDRGPRENSSIISIYERIDRDVLRSTYLLEDDSSGEIFHKGTMYFDVPKGFSNEFALDAMRCQRAISFGGEF